MPQLTDGKLKTREDVPKVVQGWEAQRVWKTSGNCMLQWNDATENLCWRSAGEAGRVLVRSSRSWRCLLWQERAGCHVEVLLSSLNNTHRSNPEGHQWLIFCPSLGWDSSSACTWGVSTLGPRADLRCTRRSSRSSSLWDRSEPWAGSWGGALLRKLAWRKDHHGVVGPTQIAPF